MQTVFSAGGNVMDFVAALRAEVEQVRRLMVKSTARYNLLRDMLRRYETVASSRKGGGPTSTRRRPTGKRVGKPAARHVTSNKTEAIRDLIVDHHTSGIAPRDIRAQLRRKGVTMTSNAVFAALSKLKQRRHVTIRGEKCFPTEALLQMLSPNKRTSAKPAN